MTTNGQSRFNTEGLDTAAKMDLMIEGLRQMADQQDQLFELFAEVLEKIDNISTPGIDFGLED